MMESPETEAARRAPSSPSPGQVLTVFGKGFAMGSADIIPGVSGGTMALILGIYERLLRAVRSFDMAWLRDVFSLKLGAAVRRNDPGLLVPLGLGILGALLFFTRVVPLPTLIHTHPEMIYGLFFGLILASSIVLYRETRGGDWRALAWIAAGAVLGFAVVNLVPLETPTAPWFIFLCGFVAISAMLLPGISGSFILLIMGKYAYIIDALGRFDLAIIVTFGLGMVCGALVFSRALVWLIGRCREATMLTITGVLLGSLWVIWPFQQRVFVEVRGKQKLIESNPMWPTSWGKTELAALAFMLLGVGLVLALHHLGRRSARVHS